jgi:hypothetical protein
MKIDAVEKRKLSEVITLYTLEPELADIYVEGINDKCLINRFFINKKFSINIVEINDIDFSDLYDTKPYLKSDCKKKIIELSDQLELNFEDTLKKITCIVDRDFDAYLNLLIVNSYLRYTDFSSIELYFFNHVSLNIFFDNILHGFPIASYQIIDQFESVLSTIFDFKLSLLQLFGIEYEVNDFNFNKLILINKVTGEISFDCPEYINRFLNSRGLANQKDIIVDRFTNISTQHTDSFIYRIRGHDLVNLLFYYINKIKNHIRLSSETFERVIILCIDLDTVFDMNLFVALRNKYINS